jgi:hypothetical protein
LKSDDGAGGDGDWLKRLKKFKEVFCDFLFLTEFFHDQISKF